VGVAGRGLRFVRSSAGPHWRPPPWRSADRWDGSIWELAFLIGQQVRFFVTGQAGVARHPLEVDLLASPQESVQVRPDGPD